MANICVSQSWVTGQYMPASTRLSVMAASVPPAASSRSLDARTSRMLMFFTIASPG